MYIHDGVDKTEKRYGDREGWGGVISLFECVEVFTSYKVKLNFVRSEKSCMSRRSNIQRCDAITSASPKLLVVNHPQTNVSPSPTAVET